MPKKEVETKNDNQKNVAQDSATKTSFNKNKRHKRLISEPLESDHKSINEMWVDLEVNKTAQNIVSCVALIMGVILIFLPMFIILSRKGLDTSKEMKNDIAIEQMFHSSSFKDYNSKYLTQSKVGYSAEYLGIVKRQHPQVSNNGLSRYPAYGITLFGTNEDEKRTILSENSWINASDTTYNSMDEQGNLFLNNEFTGRKLYKHSASVGMYGSDVKDDEPALVKKLTYVSRAAGNLITGLYAPAGEVIKIEMSEEDYAKTGGLVVYIGQVLANGQANNIWLERDFNRMPVIVNTMTTTGTTSFVGSYLGGPIYVRPVNQVAGISFSVTISGGVNYSHFILGYTTEEEFAMTSMSSAPYFDLEVWDRGVRHSGPKSYAFMYDYEDLYKAAVLWEKIACVSTQLISGSNKAIGIDFLYDPFVAAGAMVAFVGRNTVNCPLATMTSALNYNDFVTSGSWGVIHEYNHHFQRYGFAPGDEVTNNAVSLIEYSLFTKISSARNTSNDNEGLSDWNKYTNASWVLKNTLSKNSANTDLDSYANILHSFGQTNYINSACKGGGGVDAWYTALCETLHYDMTYYFEEILHLTVSDAVKSTINAKSYTMYVPVATIYQTGASYYYDDNLYYCETMQPYEVEAGKSLDVDLGSKIVLPSGFTYTIKNVSAPTSGTFVVKENNIYTYTPTATIQKSGKIYVQLGINKDDNAFNVKDVTLVLEFKQTQQSSTLLERTTYTYTEENMYANAIEAYENQYAGYTSVESGDNNNMINGRLVQNANAEIWGLQGASKNTIMQLVGKVYVPSTGKYRIALRGRTYGALYISLDGTNFEYAAKLENLNDKMVTFDMNNSQTYKDLELKKGQYLYFKVVLLVSKSNSFIGVGWGRFNGENVNVSYLNAYRNSYVFEEFVSDYFYNRSYACSYSKPENLKQSVIDYVNFTATSGNEIENLFDDDENNYILSSNSATASTPCSITVDLSKKVNANTFTIYGYSSRTKHHYPTAFELWGGIDKDNLQKIGSFEIGDGNFTANGAIVKVSFQAITLRYYKIVITNTVANSNGTTPVVFKTMKFSMELSGGKLYSADAKMFKYDEKWKGKSELSTFGHIYAGTDSTMNFEFTGTKFAIFSKKASEYGSLEIWIDGNKIDTVNLSENLNVTDLAYVSIILTNTKHQVTIKGVGKINIDSVAIW